MVTATHLHHGPIEYTAEGFVGYQLYYDIVSTTEAVQCQMRWDRCGTNDTINQDTCGKKQSRPDRRHYGRIGDIRKQKQIFMNTVFWDVTPCSLVEVHQHFRGPYCLHFQGQGASQARLHKKVDGKHGHLLLAVQYSRLKCYRLLLDYTALDRKR
jgi:hypothetical protein